MDPMAHAALRSAADGFRPVCSGLAQHVQADACNPDFVFKEGHPNLVRLPPPVPVRLADGEPTVSRHRTRFGGPSTDAIRVDDPRGAFARSDPRIFLAHWDH